MQVHWSLVMTIIWKLTACDIWVETYYSPPLTILDTEQLHVENFKLLRAEEGRRSHRRSQFWRDYNPSSPTGLHVTNSHFKSWNKCIGSHADSSRRTLYVSTIYSPSRLIVANVVKSHLLTIFWEITLTNIEIPIYEARISLDVIIRS